MVHFHEDPLTERVSAVYRDLPTLRLTTPQAARLFAVPAPRIEAVLTSLEAGGRLRRSENGSRWEAA